MHDPIRPLLDAIASWDHRAPLTPWSDARFDALAIPLFARQYALNAPYRALCDRRGVTPDTLTSWRQIPAVPTDAFKHARLSVAPLEATARTFLTSGTTAGAATRGQHHMGRLDVYEAALCAPFARAMLPDRAHIRMIIIAPSAADLPESSLSFMLSALLERHGAPGSLHTVRVGAEGALTYELDALTRALDAAVEEDEPVALLSTAFGLMHLFDEAPLRRWQLPPNSRLMETGGFKGRSREVSRAELYALFSERLGLEPSRCVSEYSMTELSSQAYTANLITGEMFEADAPPWFEVPPWVRLQVVDPLSLEPLEEPGQVGLVRWVDLANVESALAIQTSDRGELDASGQRVTLLGRAPDSELRGCSLTIEELLTPSRSGGGAP